MRVAIIKSNYTPYGGGEKYSTRLIKAFVEKKAHVDVLTAESGRWEGHIKNVCWVRMKQFRCNNLLRLLTFNSSVKQYLNNNRYDCIFGMDRTEYQTHLRVGGGCHASWIQRRCDQSNKLKCLSFRINPFHKVVIKMERKAFLSDNLKRIFCNSYLVKDEILHYYPQVEKKLFVVHNGVEWNEFADVFEEGISGQEEIKKTLKLDPDKYYFLFVGSGYARKGLGKAIKAFKLLPGYTNLIVVGRDKNEKRYRIMCDRLGLSKRVHFFGPQRDIISFLQASDAFVLPTIYDPFSNASIEALAMGLYTITTSANGCSEVIKTGAGYLIEDLRDIDSIADALRTALNGHLSKREIRNTVGYLDFDTQLNKIVDICISDI